MTSASANVPYQIYNAYRFGLTSILWALVYLNQQPQFFGAFLPNLFIISLTLYWILSLLFLYVAEFKKKQSNTLIFFTFLCDVAAWGLLLYSSGGITTGFGLVFIIICASGALLLSKNLALFIAAISTLSLVGVELWLQYIVPHRATTFSQVGGHGFLIFLVTIVIGWLRVRIQNTEAVAESYSRINAKTIELMDIGVLVTDLNERILHANHAAERLLQFAHHAGKMVKDLPADFQTAFTAKKPFLPKLHIRFQYTQMPPYQLTLIFDTKVEAQRAQQLRLAALGQMASNIAHEIRNPLSAIVQANAHLIHGGGSPEKLTSIIERQSQRMNCIIETILSLSKQPNPNLSCFTVEACLESIALPKTSIFITRKNVTQSLITDFQILQQILTILLENAAQFADAVSVETLTAEPGGYFIDIIDNGPGVHETDIPSLFDPFFTRSTTGTGLGLFIAQQLCDAVGIELYYVNDVKGAHFRLWIPPATGES